MSAIERCRMAPRAGAISARPPGRRRRAGAGVRLHGDLRRAGIRNPLRCFGPDAAAGRWRREAAGGPDTLRGRVADVATDAGIAAGPGLERHSSPDIGRVADAVLDGAGRRDAGAHLATAPGSGGGPRTRGWSTTSGASWPSSTSVTRASASPRLRMPCILYRPDGIPPRVQALDGRVTAAVPAAPVRYLKGRAPRGPNQVVRASRRPWSVPSPTHATCPSGRINTAAGAATAPSTGSCHPPE